MRFKLVGNKADTGMIVVKNPSTTIAIPAGAPLFFAFNGTDDGLAVINAYTAGSTAGLLNGFAGVAVEGVPIAGGSLPNTMESQVYGFCQTVRVVRQIRATSTDSFSSASAVSVGDILTVDTASGIDAFTDIYSSGFTFSGTGGASSSNSGVLPNYLAYAIAAASDASRSASGSSAFGSTSSGSLAVVITMKAFLASL